MSFISFEVVLNKEKLKKIVDKLFETNEQYEVKYKTFGRFWTELTNNKDKFTDYLLSDIEHTRKINAEIFHHLIGSNNSYEYPPKLLAAEIKGHILRVESLSNFFTIVLSILSIALSLLVGDVLKIGVFIVWVVLVALIKWNVDRHLVNKKQLVNHLESYPDELQK